MKDIQTLLTRLMAYVSHDRDCILSYWSAGEPGADGSYWYCYKGKWYQARPIDNTPKCDCGLEELLIEVEKND